MEIERSVKGLCFQKKEEEEEEEEDEAGRKKKNEEIRSNYCGDLWFFFPHPCPRLLVRKEKGHGCSSSPWYAPLHHFWSRESGSWTTLSSSSWRCKFFFFCFFLLFPWFGLFFVHGSLSFLYILVLWWWKYPYFQAFWSQSMDKLCFNVVLKLHLVEEYLD